MPKWWLLVLVRAVGASLSPAGYAALSSGLRKIGALRRAMDETGSAIPRFGDVADEICDQAIETLGAAQERRYVQECLEAHLKVCYEKQLRILRDVAITDFRRAVSGTTVKTADEHQELAQAERNFCLAAVEAGRADWSYDAARRELRESLFAIASRSAEVRGATLKAAQQRANYFTVLRKLVMELEDATNKRLGLDAPVDAAVAVRVPDTNINLSAALQRSKTNVQVSVVPDDSAPLLGASGFNKARVAAGDLALSYKADFNTKAGA